MDRRDTLLALLALGATPFAARAKPVSAKPFRIGLLPGLDDDLGKWPLKKGVVAVMGQFGWVEGRDFSVFSSGLEYKTENMDQDVRRMVAADPDVIIALGNGYTAGVQKLSTSIPIVMWHAGEPVTAGLANSLARPGKNVTGISTYADAGVWAKLVELLHDANPKIKRIGVLWDYVPPFNTRKLAESYLQEIRKAARAYAITLHIAEVSRSDQVPAALAQIETSRPDALLSTAGPGIGVGSRAQRIPQFAVDKRLPLAVDVRWNPLLDPYPMLVYAPSHRELMGIAVSYVDRILKGAKPAALPFQQPLKLELLVNLKTAKAIGLSVSQALLLRADVVVE